MNERIKEMKWNEVKSEANNDVLSRTATLTGGFDFQRVLNNLTSERHRF